MGETLEKKENVLLFREKPYYTEEEQELYYRIAIDESLKKGNVKLAAHFQILLNHYLSKKDDQEDSFYQTIINHTKTQG